jgi:hypothetical protein
MKEIAVKNKVHFVDAHTPTKSWFASADKPLTIDGSQLTDAGYAKFAPCSLTSFLAMSLPKLKFIGR